MILAISPHPDDALLSAGATLAAAVAVGCDVCVFTVFAGDPQPPLSAPALAFHAACRLGQDAAAVRRAEDAVAVELLGARPLHGTFLDALYRRVGSDWLCTWLGEHLQPELAHEPELERAVSDEIGDLIGELRPDLVWTCAALGHHVDHRLVRAAATSACARTATELALWEDLPYALGAEAGSLEHVHRRVELAGDLDAKLLALGAYRSQLRMLFGDSRDWRGALRDHARRRRSEHQVTELIWRHDPSVGSRPADVTAHA